MANTVNVLIKADDQASREIDNVSTSAGKLGTVIGDVAKTAAGFLSAQVIGEGFSKLNGFVTGAIDGWKQQLEVTAQTEAVLKSTGGVAGQTADSVLALADSLKKNSLFADDAIQSGENLLLTFTNIGQDVFPDATQTMVDMSQALGQDLKSSAIQLGKALNDPVQGVTALRRVGVSFTDAQLEQIKTMQESGDLMGAQKLILAELSKEFGGSAKAASDAAGSSATLEDKMDDLQDTLGAKLLPVQLKFKEAQIAIADFMLGTVLPAFERLGGFIQDTVIPAFQELQTTVAPAISAIVSSAQELASAIVDKLGQPIQQFLDWFTQIGGMQALAVGALVAITVAVGALAVVLGAAAISAIAVAAPFIAIGAAIAAVTAAVILVIQHWDELTAKFPILASVSAAVQAAVAALAAWFTGTFIPVAQQVGDAIRDKVMQQFQNFMDWINSAFLPAVKNIADTMADTFRAIVDFTKEHWDQIHAVIEDVMNIVKAIVTNQWDEIKLIFQNVLDIIQGIIKVFHGLFTGDWGEMWEGIKEIASSAADILTGTLGNMKDTLLGILGTFKDEAVGIWNAFRDALGGIADNIRDRVVGAFQGMVDTVRNLFNGLIDRINGVIGAINSALQFSVTIPGVDLPGPLPDIPSTSFSFNAPDIPSVPRLASGGIVRRPTLALIGEAGPEAVVPLNGAGRNVTVNLHVGGSILSERDLVRIIRNEFLNGGFGDIFNNFGLGPQGI